MPKASKHARLRAGSGNGERAGVTRAGIKLTASQLLAHSDEVCAIALEKLQ